MTRRSPRLHTVRSHNRKGGVSVTTYRRGSGTKTHSSSGYTSPRLPTDVHGRKKRKVGDRISYKNPRGEWVSGTVRAVRKEHFLVERKDKLYKVDRRSIFTQLGGALKTTARTSKYLVVKTPGAIRKTARVAGAVAGAPERTERRVKRFRAELKREFEKGKRKGLPKKERKIHYLVNFIPLKGKEKTFRRKFRTRETATKFIKGRVKLTKPGDIYSIGRHQG